MLVGSQDSRVYDVARDGTLKWSYATGDIIFSSPAVAHDGTVYIGSDDDHLYAVTPREGKPRWIVQLGACPQRVGIGPEASRCDVDGGPTIGPDGVIYTGGDGIYAINPDGTLRWHFVTNGHVSSAPALLPDGTVVAGARTTSFMPWPPTARSAGIFGPAADIEPAPAIGDDGTIYVGSDDHKLYAIGPDGVLRWAFTTGADVRSSVAIGNGIIYVGSFDAQLYAVHLDGTLAWSFRAGDRIVSSPLVDAAGAVLFGSQDDRLYCLEPDGHLRWSVELGGDIDSSPTLGSRRHHLRGLGRSQALRAARAERIAAPRQTLERNTHWTIHRWARRFSGLPVRTLTGQIKIHPVGYGFVVPDDKSEDVHVSARNRGDGDGRRHRRDRGLARRQRRRGSGDPRALARARQDHRPAGARGAAPGAAARRSAHHRPGVAERARSPRRSDGIAVVAEITRYPDVPDGPIEAKVLKVLGDPDDPRTEVEKVLACADVEEEFPDEVERIAAALRRRR